MHLFKIFNILCIAIILILLGSYYLHPVTNIVGDLGYYLKIGEIIFTTHTIPATNLFSYTNQNFPFINTNWLAEVLFFVWYRSFGGNGLIVLSILLAIGTFGILLKSTFGKYSLTAIAIISLIYIQIMYERTEIKPELFSYLLLASFIAILYRYRKTGTRLIYALIPLQLLWTNLHIFFFLGIGVQMFFLFDEIIAKKGRLNSKKLHTLALVTALSLASTLINPNFIKGALYPFFVMQNYGFKVEENIGFLSAVNSYSDTTFPFFEISLVVLWLGILFVWNKLKPVDILLAFFFTSLGLYAVRTFPLFAIGTFLPIVAVSSEIIIYLEKSYKKYGQQRIFIIKTCFVVGIFILIMPTIKQNIEIHGFGFGIVDNANDAIKFLETNDIKGPIYNNYDIGNYLDFKLYPKEKVFVDARPEAYPKTFFTDVYFPMQSSQDIFNNMDRKYKFNVAIIAHTDTSPSGTQFLRNIINTTNWKMVYLNNTVAIFLKNSEQNKIVIKNNFINQDNLQLKTKDIGNKNNVRQLVNFFRAVGWEKPWLDMNLRYLKFEPNNCAALQNIVFIYQKQQKKEAPIYTGKFLEHCN